MECEAGYFNGYFKYNDAIVFTRQISKRLMVNCIKNGFIYIAELAFKVLTVGKDFGKKKCNFLGGLTKCCIAFHLL